LLGNGNGTFQAPVNYAAGEGVRSIVVGDFNGDERLDLAVANERSRSISLLFGQGDGTFSAPANYNVNVSPRSVAASDFNGDGRLDLAVASENGAIILTNTCFSITTADLSLTMVDIPDPIGVGDHVTYTQTVRNRGPGSALQVEVSDLLPPAVRFVAATSSQGMCSALNNEIHCVLVTMTNGSEATISVEVVALNVGSVTNTARVSSVAIIDPDNSNNSATSVITVLPVIALAATDASASESAPDPRVFTISRTGGMAEALAVDYKLEGTASNGVDYELLAGSVIIPSGATFATVTVTPQEDAIMEENETVVMTLLANPSYRVDPSSNTATVFIADNDLPFF